MKDKLKLTEELVEASLRDVDKTIKNGYVGQGWYVIDGTMYVRRQGWEYFKNLKNESKPR